MPDQPPSPTNTRGALRFRAALEGELVASGGGEVPLTTLNVSTGGVLARTARPVSPFEQVSLRLLLGDADFESEAVCLRATRAHPFEAAFFFLDPEPHVRLALLDFLQGRFESYA